MGTSSSFGGGSRHNTLIPSWLDYEFDDDKSKDQDDAEQNNEGEGDEEKDVDQSQKDDNRFKDARTNFTRFINSGGTSSKSLGRAISTYIKKTSGGASKATRRMLSDRGVAVALGNLLFEAGSKGIDQVASEFNLGDLTDRSTFEIYAALVDIICSPGGDLDDSYARDAYLNAIVEISEMGITDLEKPSLETITQIMERFIANSIYDRILNSIGNKTILLPDNIQTVQNIELQIKQFIAGAVSDAFSLLEKSFLPEEMKSFINTLYEQSFIILQNLADEEAEK